MRSPFLFIVRLLVICLLLLSLMPGPAIASVHEYPAPDGGLLFRSLQTVRDERDRAWQTVLYKQVSPSGVSQIHLRLVGFPGAATFRPTKPLVITVEAINAQIAPDVSLDYLTTNAREYDLSTVLTQLANPAPLRLELPLETGQLELVIPPFVVREWRQVAEWQP
jgi:Protein of unknown function (DUF3122)